MRSGQLHCITQNTHTLTHTSSDLWNNASKFNQNLCQPENIKMSTSVTVSPFFRLKQGKQCGYTRQIYKDSWCFRLELTWSNHSAHQRRSLQDWHRAQAEVWSLPTTKEYRVSWEAEQLFILCALKHGHTRLSKLSTENGTSRNLV